MAETRPVSIVEKLAARLSRAEQARTAPADPGDDLAAYAADATDDAVLESILPGQTLRVIPLDHIAPAAEGQVRQQFDEERLRTLAESLKRSGVREPIIVTPHGAAPGRFQIVAGERRWRAAQLAGLTEIPCIVDPSLVDRRDKLLAQAEENLHRENLNPIEEASVLAQLMDSRGLDVRAAGELMGRSYIQARRLLRLHTAAEPIKEAVSRGDLDARAAVEVVRIHNKLAQEDGSPGQQDSLAEIVKLIDRIVRENWSTRRIEQYASRIGAPGGEREGEDQPDITNVSATAPESRGAPKLTAGDDAPGPAGREPVPETSDPAASRDAPPHPLLVRGEGCVTINEARLHPGGVSPEEREELISVLEALLMRVRRC